MHIGQDLRIGRGGLSKDYKVNNLKNKNISAQFVTEVHRPSHPNFL